MPHRRTTFSKFIIEDLRRNVGHDPDLTGLLNDVMTACKQIGAALSRGALYGLGTTAPGARTPFPTVANEIMVGGCEWGGQLCGMVSSEMAQPYAIPAGYPRGRYLLVFTPLDGASNIDIDVNVGTIFSVLRAPEGVSDPALADFLQPGTSQIAAGYALYGAASLLVLSTGAGVNGFTLDRETGAYTLTHPDMRIAPETADCAINASNERHWEPPVRRYVSECIEGEAGPRGKDFNMRWIASVVAELHRVLVRGGLVLYPRDTSDAAARTGRLRLLSEANPIAMLVEQAGGAASTGRARILETPPTEIHQRVPVMLGSRNEVERLVKLHTSYDAGEELVFESPLFKTRSLFRGTAGVAGL
jgi:fructose-1,6-bisphosphatase I